MKKQRIFSAALCVLLVFLCCLQSLCQLVRAGGGSAAAADALYAGDDFIDIHALNELADALQVTVAAAEEVQVMYLAVLNVKNDLLRAGAAGFVSVLHSDASFL